MIVDMNPTNTAKYPTAAAQILAAAGKAAASFTGIDWESGPQQLVAALEAGRRVDEDDLAGAFWAADGSHESQRLSAQWCSLLADLPTGDHADLLERAQEMVDAEAAAVKDRAAAAAELGRKAAELVGAGRWPEAIAAAEQAAGIEREFGDAPAWGKLARAIKALPEYVAALTADDNYQHDDRSDEEIAADAERLANDSCAANINAGAGENSDEWIDRYAAAYRAEIAEWCAL